MTARQRRDEAYRMRAGLVGDLLSCVCEYPLTKAKTSTEHDEHCPTHYAITQRHKREQEQSHGDDHRQ